MKKFAAAAVIMLCALALAGVVAGGTFGGGTFGASGRSLSFGFLVDSNNKGTPPDSSAVTFSSCSFDTTTASNIEAGFALNGLMEDVQVSVQSKWFAGGTWEYATPAWEDVPYEGVLSHDTGPLGVSTATAANDTIYFRYSLREANKTKTSAWFGPIKKVFRRASLSINTTITSGAVWIDTPGTAGNFKIVVYENDGDKVATSNGTAIGEGLDWATATFSTPYELTAGEDYTLVVIFDGTTTLGKIGTSGVRYGTGGTYDTPQATLVNTGAFTATELLLYVKNGDGELLLGQDNTSGSSISGNTAANRNYYRLTKYTCPTSF